jgi:hypothetical protein
LEEEVSDESSSDEKVEEEEVDSTEEEGEDEAEGEEEEDDKAMVKTPPRKPKSKAKASPRPRAADVDDLTQNVSRMRFDPGYSVDFAFPHVLYSYQRNGVNYCTVDMFVPPLPQASFQPFVADDLMSVGVNVKLPPIFTRKNRLLQADQTLDGNNTKAAAFEKQCQIIKETFDFADDIIGKNAYTVSTPFKVEPAIVMWEVLYYPNAHDGLTDLLGGQQFYGVLSVELRSVEKPKQRRVGRARVIGAAENEEPQAMEQDGGDDDL